MIQAKLRASIDCGSADEVEAAFYDALHKGDLAQLMACWADEEEIACVFPGGVRAFGAEAIRQQFEAIFTHGPLRLQAQHVHKLAALGSAVHSVLEWLEVDGPNGPLYSLVLATNVYLKTTQGWRLAAHHASPGKVTPTRNDPSEQPVLH